MTAFMDQVRVEDMPSLDDTIICQSTYGCDRPADWRWAGHCCAARRAWVESIEGDFVRFLCDEHLRSWTRRCGHDMMRCQFCEKRSADILDFDYWKALM